MKIFVEPAEKPKLILKPKRPSFFKSGVITYVDSGHVLTLSDRYYRCSLNCNGKCRNKEEKQLPKRTFERRFCRLVNKINIDPEKIIQFFGNSVRKMFCQIIMDDELNVELDFQEEKMANSLDLMKQGALGIQNEKQRINFEKTKKHPKGVIKKSDILDYQNAYVKSLNEKRSYWLMAYALGALKTFGTPMNERDKGNAIGYMSKNILISNMGKIISIELEDWAQYIFIYINQRVPGFIEQALRARIIPFTIAENNPNLIKAGKRFKCSECDPFFGQHGGMILKMFEMAKRLINTITSGADTPQQQKEVLAFYYSLQNDPVFRLSMEQLPILLKDIKLK